VTTTKGLRVVVKPQSGVKLSSPPLDLGTRLGVPSKVGRGRMRQFIDTLVASSSFAVLCLLDLYAGSDILCFKHFSLTVDGSGRCLIDRWL